MVKKQIDEYVHIPQQVYGSHLIQIELTNKLLDISSFKNSLLLIFDFMYGR